MRCAVFALIACLPLAGCGPKTVVSMLFPTRYAVTTAIDFDDNGRATRQIVVTGCKVVDQTDSIAANTHTEVTGERHWIRRADGSLWVIGLLDACRWGPKGPRDERVAKPFAAELAHQQRDQSWRVPASYTYRFDDPAEPTQVEAYDTARLFAEGAQGLRLSGQLGAGGGAPTDSLRAAFPFLAHADARAAEISASVKDKPYEVRAAAAIAPGGFIGFRVTARELRNGACPAPDPNAEGPIVLPRDVACQYADECHERTAVDRLCEVTLGGLRPSFVPGYREVRYSLADRDRAFIYRLARAEVLQAAGAPSRPGLGFDWTPRVCLDGACHELERLGGLYLYYPKRNVFVEIWGANHNARGQLFLAESAPVWSGTD